MGSQSFHRLFHEAAQRHGALPAVQCGPRVRSYSEIDRESNRLANYLISQGARKGSTIAILAGDRAAIITAMLGVLKAGGIFCPLDVNFPDLRLAAMLSQAGPEWFVAEPAHAHRLSALYPGRMANVVCLEGESVPELEHPLVLHAAYQAYTGVGYPDLDLPPGGPCSLYFTSGSTGAPKAILGCLSGIAHFGVWEAGYTRSGEGSRFSQLFSPAYDGFLMDIAPPLCVGGTVCAPPSNDLVLQPPALIDWLHTERIEVLQCVPSILRSILNEDPPESMFPALRFAGTTGEPLLPSDVRRWRAKFGDRIQLLNLYGPTETAIVKLYHAVRPGDEDLKSVPIGSPLPDTGVILVDEQGGTPPDGETGEILIQTPHCALGYLNESELTAEVFDLAPEHGDPVYRTGDPVYRTGDPVYRTGDLGYRSGGLYYFAGRKDKQVKVRGVRIEIGEIESQLYRHPAVREVAVLCHEDSFGYNYLCAYVVPRHSANGGDRELMADLKRRLAAHLPAAMIPSAFVVVDSLPRTLTGKVDRKALPSPHEADRGCTTVEPRTQTELDIARMWGAVLGLERIGVFDDFFAIGGHSLVAAQIVTGIQRMYGISVPARIIFENPTVAGLAHHIEAFQFSRPRAVAAGSVEEGVL